MTLGMEWIRVPGTTGSYDSSFHLKAHAICEAVSRQENPFEFGFLHVKAVDDCGHDRLWGLKVRYLEVMDLMVGQIIRLLHQTEQVGLWDRKVRKPAFIHSKDANREVLR